MDSGKQRAMIRKSVAACKQYREASALDPKVASKVAPKRKSNMKDDCLSKKPTGPSVGVDCEDQ